MPQDELEQFIRVNKDQFAQIEQPDLNRLWSDFNRSQASTSAGRKYWLLAASVAIAVALLAGLIGYSMGGSAQPSLAALIAEDHYLSAHYENLSAEIAKREEQVAAKNIQKEDYETLFQALEEWDGLQQLYEADLANYSNEQELIRSLLQHHEKKIRLLELLLFEVEKKSKYEQRDQFTNL